jgi:hypothetical protein
MRNGIAQGPTEEEKRKGVGGDTLGLWGNRIDYKFFKDLDSVVEKRKNETCWNYSRNERGGIKKNDGGDEYNYDIL